MAEMKSLTINGTKYDSFPGSVDATLSIEGEAADAKAVGDALATLSLGQSNDGFVYIFINGKPVGDGLSIEVVPVDIKLGDIVSYYQAPTKAVADEINALDENWVSFIAVTDTHSEWSKNNSQNIIRYLLKYTPAKRVFHLGDISDSWSEPEYKAWFAPFENCMHQLFYALGNHESWSAASDLAVIYEDILADKDYLNGNPENFYYYFDDNTRKVRYLVINTSDVVGNVVSETQLAWIQESVQLPSSDWKLVAFGHIDINPNDPISGEWVPSNASEIVSAFSSTNGKFVGYFCGHEHHDRIVFINDSIYQTILINDSCRQDTEYENWVNPERTAGTTSEHAVSVVSFNTVTGAVDIRRIGVGTDMAYNYLAQPENGLTGISATYSGGNVPVGTAVTDLTGIVVVATYTNGGTETVTDYTLSGTIAEGSNTITVSYEGMTATFTVTGIADSGGEEEPDKPTTGISAVYSPTKQDKNFAHIVFDTDTLDSLREYLTVTNNENGNEITDYTLEGDLSNGNSVVTVSSGGETCACEVPLMRFEMGQNELLIGQAQWEYNSVLDMYFNDNKDKAGCPLFIRAKPGYVYTLTLNLADSVSVYAAFEYFGSNTVEKVNNRENFYPTIERPWSSYEGVYTDSVSEGSGDIGFVRIVMKPNGFTTFESGMFTGGILTITPIE